MVKPPVCSNRVVWPLQTLGLLLAQAQAPACRRSLAARRSGYSNLGEIVGDAVWIVQPYRCKRKALQCAERLLDGDLPGFGQCLHRFDVGDHILNAAAPGVRGQRFVEAPQVDDRRAVTIWIFGDVKNRILYRRQQIGRASSWE